jgi:hypothetical protein
LLLNGFKVQAVRDHGKLLHDFCGRSGDAPHRYARGMDLHEDTVVEWFDGRNVQVINSLE